MGPNDDNTVTPIRHVIVIVGENGRFDHVFATYRAPSGDKVTDPRSAEIINADASPGPNVSGVLPNQVADTTTDRIAPTKTGPYARPPSPNSDGAASAARDPNPPPFATIAAAVDHGELARDIRVLTTGATGLPADVVETRIINVASLQSGPFQLTPAVSNDAYAAGPVHRFHQMRQQADCSRRTASAASPSGCPADLFAWVKVTEGATSNGAPQPSGINAETTDEGASSMGFYNMQQGDAPHFKQRADRHTVSDNHHQPGMGGTDPDHVVGFFGDRTRIPLIVVSRHATGGHVNHSDAEHTSLVKFIAANRKLPTLSGGSRDNLANPVATANRYVPTSSPAIDNLMDIFHFNQGSGGNNGQNGNQNQN